LGPICFQADRRGEAGWAGSDDDDIEIDRLAGR